MGILRFHQGTSPRRSTRSRLIAATPSFGGGGFRGAGRGAGGGAFWRKVGLSTIGGLVPGTSVQGGNG
eukprot:12924678-Prorocentrum_lima.AAC.1